MYFNWIPMGYAAMTGAMGGLVLDVIQDRTLDLPRLTREGLYMGFLSDMLAGAVGGAAAYASTGGNGAAGLSPQLVAQLLSGSGVAGYLKAAGYARGR